MRDDLNLPLLYSAVGHLVVVLVFTVKAVFFPEAIEVYQPAIRVDIVDLPDKLPSQPPPPVAEAPKPEPEKAEPAAPPEPPKPEVNEPEPEVVLSPKKQDIKSKEDSKLTAAEAIKKLKKQAAIDRIKEEMKETERQELAQRVSQYKGNVLSPGTELTGVNKLQHENYLGDLDRHVKQFWSLPEWLARGNYSAQVRVFIDDHGLLLKAQLVKSSGNPSYDETVIETVKKAVPFPVPPEKFRAIVSVNGMVLGFPE
jgi:colicin import membrane protein